MTNGKKTFAVLTVAAIMGAASCITASARDTDYTREEIIDLFWTEYWGDTLPGEENAEGSLEYYILESFLDEQYGEWDLVSNWSSYTSIKNGWKTYHEIYTENWHLNDDEETGEFTIESYDPETGVTGDTLYTFELIDGMWNMIDMNGNTVLTFEPHGGDGSLAALQEEKDFVFDESDGAYMIDPDTGEFIRKSEYSGDNNTDNDDQTITTEKRYVENENGEKVLVEDSDSAADLKTEEASPTYGSTDSPTYGSTDSAATADSDSAESEHEDSEAENDEGGLAVPLAIGGAAVAGGGAGAIAYSIKKKRAGKKL